MVLQMARPVGAEVLGASGWVAAHEAVLRVARERAGLERREGVCLLGALRESVHRHLGYGAFAEYTDRDLGYGPRTTEDKLRTAAALEHLPELARAQREGRLSASAVRELARVATAETESAWIEAAAGLRVREVERLVSGRVPGDRPTDPGRPEVARHVLRFDVSAATLAAFRDAMRCVAERSGQRLDDDAALLLIARGILDASSAAARDRDRRGLGRSAYQISITECDRCKRAYVRAGADLLEIDAATLAAARCDAQRVGPSRAPCDVRRLWPGTSHVEGCATGTASDTTPVAASETHAGHGAEPAGSGATAGAVDVRPSRVARSIPAAVRRSVLERDHGICQIPGCRNTLGVEVHHIQPRSEGGSNRSENLVCICSVHHPAIHRGQLQVSGTALALVVRHATARRMAATSPRADRTRARRSSGVCAGWVSRSATREPRSRRRLPRPMAAAPSMTRGCCVERCRT